MDNRKEKRAKRSQLIHQLQQLEIQHELLHGPLSLISQCEGCEVCVKIRDIGEQLSPSHVDICTASGLTIERYHEMCGKGMTDKEISVYFMVATTSLINWKNKNNLARKRPLINISVKKYIQLREKGLTVKEVAAKFKCSTRTLSRWVAENNLGNVKMGVKQ